MSRGNWFSLVALAGGLILAGSADAQIVQHDARSNSPAQQTQPQPKTEIQPSDLTAIKNQIERIGTALESANNDANSAEEKDYAQRNLKAQERVADWAPAVFFVAFIELIVTAVGVYFIYQTIKETRRIGQAQVRAYVSIKSVAIRFVDITENMTYPSVSVVAENSGQSPARNFVWRATLQYICDGQARKRGDNGPWVLSPGKPISARGELEGDSFVVSDMLIDQFFSTTPRHGPILVRGKIEFKYVDVFDQTVTDEAYFSGITDIVMNTVEPVERWATPRITSEPRFSDWDGNQSFHNQ
jgi:hypothetical protein